MDAGWSGRIVVSTRGGRARELLERLQEWVEDEQSQLGLEPRERADASPAETARRPRAEEEDEKPAALRFAPEPRSAPRWYVSYAWNDPADPQREGEVDRICAEAEKRGTPIIRDKTVLTFGDRIQEFMYKIGQGERIFVFLTDKYLHSEFCMYELFEIWRASRSDEGEFAKRVRLYLLADAKIFEIEDRLDYADFWNDKFTKLDERLKRTGPSGMADKDFKRYKLMQDFAHHVGDILALFADTLLPRTFEDFRTYGFDDPP